MWTYGEAVTLPTRVVCTELFSGSRSSEQRRKRRKGKRPLCRCLLESTTSGRSSEIFNVLRIYFHAMKRGRIHPALYLLTLPSFLPAFHPNTHLVGLDARTSGKGHRDESGFTSVLRSFDQQAQRKPPAGWAHP